MTIRDLKQQRAKLVQDCRELLNKAEKEKRSLSAEENQQYEKIEKDVDEIGSQVEREERLKARELEIARKAIEDPGKSSENNSENRTNPRAGLEYRKAFQSYLAGGLPNLQPDEYRVLSAGSDIAGGYLIPPEQFVSELIKAVDDMVFIRQRARKFTLTSAASLGVPVLDADISDSNWTTEILTGTADTTMTFGKRSLYPHPLAKPILVSKQLLRQSPMNAETLVRERMAYKFGITEERAFLNGTGVQQPLGVFTASAQGIPAAQDVSTGNSATALTADGLIEAKFHLKQQYWSKAVWIFSRTAVKNIRKLKDGEGQYLWQPGITGGIPDRIIEVPYVISEYAPDTWTTGLYVGIIGDFSNYWIVDALDLQIQRVDELYAATNQTGFFGRAELDGMPVLAEAFIRVTLG